MKIFVDMDGVCCDWMRSAICRVLLRRKTPEGETRPEIEDVIKEAYANWPDGDPFGFTTTKFWDNLAIAGERWWYNLEEFHHYRPMIKMLKRQGDVVYLTSPPYGDVGAHAAYGKICWLTHTSREGPRFRDYVISSRKELLANPSSILIDDSTVKCDKFRLHGGHAILFPQPWNGGKELSSHDVIAYLMACINNIKDTKPKDVRVATIHDTDY